MAGWLVSCVFTGFALPVPAQEVHPVVEDRVDYGNGQTPVVVDSSTRRGGLELSAAILTAYDNNIFLSTKNPESDTVFRVAPLIAYTKGDDKSGEGGFIKTAYRPTVVVYVDHGSQNRIDQEALLTAGWRGRVTSVTYNGAFQKLGDTTPDTGRPADRNVFSNEIRAAWAPREKTVYEIAAGTRNLDYADPALFDSDKTYGEAVFRYIYSPKTELGLIYQIGRYKVDGGGPQDTQQLAASMAWQPREKIRLKLIAGGEYRKFDNGSSTNPVLEGRVDWTPRSGTNLYLTAYMRQETSAYYAGQNYRVKGVTAGVSQRVNGDWSVKLDGSFEKNHYEQVSGAGSGTGARTDTIWALGPSLVRRIGDNSELMFFYRVSRDSSTDKAFGFDDQTIGIGFNHNF
jgi:hypothetical protein